ncbi:MAG: CTB family bacteriocin [Nostoc sp. LLA-1]|nr:CTB family bacteriocin [Cyanocohniella sp. LLY]
MSNQLFTEVSVEQQEIVTGGFDVFASDSAFFSSLFAARASNASAGPGGATSSSIQVYTTTFSSANSFLSGFGL